MRLNAGPVLCGRKFESGGVGGVVNFDKYAPGMGKGEAGVVRRYPADSERTGDAAAGVVDLDRPSAGTTAGGGDGPRADHVRTASRPVSCRDAGAPGS